MDYTAGVVTLPLPLKLHRKLKWIQTNQYLHEGVNYKLAQRPFKPREMRQQLYTSSVKWLFTRQEFSERFQMKNNVFGVSTCYCGQNSGKKNIIVDIAFCWEPPVTKYHPSLASTGDTGCKWPGSAAKESSVVQTWPVIKSVACSEVLYLLIFAQAVIMVDCGLRSTE